MSKHVLSIFLLLVGVVGSDMLVSPIHAMDNGVEAPEGKMSGEQESIRGKWIADGVVGMVSKVPVVRKIAKWYEYHMSGQNFIPEYHFKDKNPAPAPLDDGAKLFGENVLSGSENEKDGGLKRLGLKLLVDRKGKISYATAGEGELVYHVAVNDDGAIIGQPWAYYAKESPVFFIHTYFLQKKKMEHCCGLEVCEKW